jgi:pilus assembly protein CpaE
MMSFGQMEMIKDKVKVVVNRVGLDSHIGLKKAEETIGQEIFWQLPNDYRTMVEVRNNGVPLLEQAPKAAITQSIISLAAALTGDKDACQPPTELSTTAKAVEKLLNLWPNRGKLPIGK